MTPRPADPAARDRRRAQILAAAAAEFAARGFDRATAATIARRAGVSSGTIFHHFGDKASLFRALFDGEQERIGALAAAVRGNGAIESVVAIVTALADDAREPYAAALTLELIRRTGADAALAELMTALDDQLVTLLAELIERGQREGVIDSSRAAFESARLIAAMIDGVVLRGDASLAGALPHATVAMLTTAAQGDR